MNGPYIHIHEYMNKVFLINNNTTIQPRFLSVNEFTILSGFQFCKLLHCIVAVYDSTQTQLLVISKILPPSELYAIPSSHA